MPQQNIPHCVLAVLASVPGPQGEQEEAPGSGLIELSSQVLQVVISLAL